MNRVMTRLAKRSRREEEKIRQGGGNPNFKPESLFNNKKNTNFSKECVPSGKKKRARSSTEKRGKIEETIARGLSKERTSVRD